MIDYKLCKANDGGISPVVFGFNKTDASKIINCLFNDDVKNEYGISHIQEIIEDTRDFSLKPKTFTITMDVDASLIKNSAQKLSSLNSLCILVSKSAIVNYMSKYDIHTAISELKDYSEYFIDIINRIYVVGYTSTVGKDEDNYKATPLNEWLKNNDYKYSATALPDIGTEVIAFPKYTDKVVIVVLDEFKKRGVLFRKDGYLPSVSLKKNTSPFLASLGFVSDELGLIMTRGGTSHVIDYNNESNSETFIQYVCMEEYLVLHDDLIEKDYKFIPIKDISKMLKKSEFVDINMYAILSNDMMRIVLEVGDTWDDAE